MELLKGGQLMASVFISYRRTDSADWAYRLNRHLTMRYGKDLIFQDVDDIKPGNKILELGPGPGAFTLDAARRTGTEGSLTVVDIQPEMIERVNKQLHEAGITNTNTYVAFVEKILLCLPSFPEKHSDLYLPFYTTHQSIFQEHKILP